LEIIGPVNNDVVVGKYLQSVIGGQRCFVSLYLNVRIHLGNSFPGRLQLWLTDVCGRVNDLSLEVGEIDDIKIDDPHLPYARGRQIQGQRGTESARADAQDLCCL
jgi:hypothetical protein